MPTPFTEVKPKDLQHLQGHATYKQAWTELTAIKDALKVPSLLVTHLAEYWRVPAAEILAKYP
jgi:hypothetical protein